MSAFFFNKKIYRWLLWGILGVFFLSTAFYTVYIRKTVKIPLQRTFYFLVSTSTHIEAGTHFAAWNGGAGYLLQNGEREYVAYSVYLSEEEGEGVQTALFHIGENTVLLPITINGLYVKSWKMKKYVAQIKGAFSSLYGCLQILNAEITRISNGGTQQSGKKMLEILQRELGFLGREYEKIFPQYATVCKNGQISLNYLRENTILLKDLRYILCSFCMKFIQLSELFSM